jgi:hypothetical protein
VNSPAEHHGAVSLGFCSDARAWLELKECAVPWGGSLEGRVCLRGGARPHGIAQIAVSLIQRDTGMLLNHQELLDGELLLLPGQIAWRNVRVPTPWGVPFAPGILLLVTVGCSGWKRSLYIPVEVLPPDDVAAAVAELEAVAGMSVRRWWSIDGGTDMAAELLPNTPDTCVNHIHVELFRDAAHFSGDVTVESRQSRVTTLFSPNCRYFTVRFPRSDLAAAREQFQSVLDKVRRRRGPGRALPIPSETPGRAVDALPIAARCGPELEQWRQADGWTRTSSSDPRNAPGGARRE